MRNNPSEWGPFRWLTVWLLSDLSSMERSGPSALPQEITREVVTLHARVLLRMPVIQLLFVGCVGWIVLPSVPLKIFLLWSFLTVSMECLRAVCAWWILPRVETLVPKRLHAMFMALDAMAGATVGLSGILFLPRLPLLSQVLIEIILYAIAAAGVSVAVSSKYMLAAYSFLVLLGASAPWVLLHPDKAMSVVSLTLLYWFFLIGVAAESERLLYRSVKIRQERDRVLATASHDLRQPLHALSLYSTVLASNPSKQALQEVGKSIDHIVRELGAMLTDLLDLSKFSSGGYQFQREFFPLDKIISDVCEEFVSATAAKGLEFRHSLSPIQISGDSQAVARIARNLIDNAVKFTNQGKIHVSTALSKDGGIILSVTDTGKGIAGIDQKYIFEEFYQVDNPNRDRSKGAGLGLSIVSRLAGLMGARISVNSVLGDGTCFQVAFPGPALSSGPIPPASGGDVAQKDFLDGVHVYLVDDESYIRNSMESLLMLWGASVKTSASPGEIDTLLENFGPPDLLVADLRLGEGENGLALVHRLRGTFGHFPVLMITGETSPQALSMVQKSGVVLLKKPVSAEDLQSAIRDILAHSVVSHK